MIGRIRKSIKNYFLRSMQIPNQEACLSLLARKGFQPDRIFDIGAYVGSFAKTCRTHWPNAEIICFEPLKHQDNKLENWANQDGNSPVIRCLLGEEDNPDSHIYSRETASSVLQEKCDLSATPINVPMRRLDSLIQSGEVALPQFCKIDTQGYEYPILSGLGNYISQIEVFLVETNLIDIHLDVALAHKVVQRFADAGLVLFDICEIHRRPLDNLVWQADLIFVREDSSLRADKRWN